MNRLLKEKSFVFGFLFLSTLFVMSFVYTYGIKDPNDKPQAVLYNENQELVARAPFPPSEDFLLGSDKEGKGVLTNLIEGAKYTVGLAILLSLIRIILSFILGYIFYTLPKLLKDKIEVLCDAYHYAPTAIFAYLLLSPAIIAFSWSYDEKVKLLLTIGVIVALAIPILSVLIMREIEHVFSKEFISSCRLIGGSSMHIFLKHVTPFLIPKIIILFVQQVGQVLTLFAHLALLDIFIGGGKQVIMGMDLEGNLLMESFSLSSEWGGLIGKSWNSFMSYPWMLFGPILAFTLTILAVNFMASGLIRWNQREYNVPSNKKSKSSPSEMKASNENVFSFDKVKFTEKSG
ncbi:ABC transporter permease subunit [Bacillus sp. E(2018)]|uniref:ABC transporter permease subunit n=1 Tax=Bacillus sp. E(2018) TaxID=2502239 RepID=UPI0010F5D61C|nr:ABC transporter permease subunit [Bacillus sp. E(2018)]